MDPNVRTEPGDAGRSLRVGWIGAGKMGAPMIRNLLARRIGVAVTDPSAPALSGLLAAGASEARTPVDHAGSDIVFSTLPDDHALREVVLGGPSQQGLVVSLAPGAILVEMSTVSPDCSRRVAEGLEEAGILYLRAPLSGSTALAEKAALTVLASGDEDAWTMALPHLEMISSRQFYLGVGEEARFMKLVLNTLVGATSAMLSEALALGASGGLSRSDMMEVICESAVASPLLKYKTAAVVNDDYTPAFSMEQMIKDFTLISDTARTQSVPLFATGLTLELYRAAANAGLKDEDFFALVQWYQGMSSR